VTYVSLHLSEGSSSEALMAFRSSGLWQSGTASPSVWMRAHASPIRAPPFVARLNPGMGHASGQAIRKR